MRQKTFLREYSVREGIRVKELEIAFNFKTWRKVKHRRADLTIPNP